MPDIYTDRTSARAGELVTFFASAPQAPCRLEIARIGAARELVLTLEGLEISAHPVPASAVAQGCGWPAAGAFTVGHDWRSGYYDLCLTDGAGEQSHHFLCVLPPQGGASRMALVLAVNTWQAYNYWGGANAYCDVAALMDRGAPLAEAMAGAAGVLSSHRPFAQPIIAASPDLPRLVNLTKRGFQRRPWGGADPAWSKAHRQTPYDGSAGFLNKWEHRFVEWAEGKQGLGLDYLTDRDLDADPDVLAGYDKVLLVGHSEYWSAAQRDRLEQFVDGGGHLVILSGNTGFWKVRWDGPTMICHKWRGFEAEGVEAARATHLWSHPAFGRPEAELTGLSFVFGGYHRLGLCAARGQGGYTVYRPDHWALAGADLYWGDVFGDQVPLIGYENDGCAIGFGDDGLPYPRPILGVPSDLEIIAMAPAAFGEAPGPYTPIIPPEKLDVVAKIAFGDDGPEAQGRVLRGHAVMASFRRGRGEVFNCGTTEWVHGLIAGDPFVERITLNVLARRIAR